MPIETSIHVNVQKIKSEICDGGWAQRVVDWCGAQSYLVALKGPVVVSYATELGQKRCRNEAQRASSTPSDQYVEKKNFVRDAKKTWNN